MDLKKLYDLINSENILVKYNLPYNFFTLPEKMYDEEICLNEIIFILNTKNITFPLNDSSDINEMLENKCKNILQQPYKNIEFDIKLKHHKTPYIEKPTNNSFINFLCFLKAFASNTYTHKGSFKEYFKEVFNIMYDPL
jgi:hypothetical protein